MRFSKQCSNSARLGVVDLHLIRKRGLMHVMCPNEKDEYKRNKLLGHVTNGIFRQTTEIERMEVLSTSS